MRRSSLLAVLVCACLIAAPVPKRTAKPGSVALTANPQPVISAPLTPLVFVGLYPTPKTVLVTVSPAQYATGYTITVTTNVITGGDWLSATISGGSSPQTLTISVNAANLPIGTYTGTVTLSGNGAADVIIPVTYPFNPGPPPGSEVGIFRGGTQWLLDANDDDQYYGPPYDIYNVNFVTPAAGDIPVTGDWNGTHTSKIGIYRPSTGQWFLDFNGNGVFDAGDQTYNFGGLPGDIPVVGDWSGRGTAKIGIFRSGFFWILDYNGNGVFDADDEAFAYGGIPGDVPVTGNWNGGPITEVGVVRPFSTGGAPAFWLLDANNDHVIDAGDLIFAYGGIAGDVPVVGAWGGAGQSRAGIFRQGFFWILDFNGSAPMVLGGSGNVAFPFGGIAGDVPVVGVWR